MDIYYIYLEIY